MRFLVDAQLPRRFCAWLAEGGHDAVHTLDLPEGNRTPDAQIIAIAEQEQRIVVTKDDDFVQSYLVKGVPSRLLLVSAGNVANDELERLLIMQRGAILDAFKTSRFVELGREYLMVHE